jgi:hypothetical protein
MRQHSLWGCVLSAITRGDLQILTLGPKVLLLVGRRARARQPATSNRPRASCQIGARACASQLDRSQRSRISDHVEWPAQGEVHGGTSARAGQLTTTRICHYALCIGSNSYLYFKKMQITAI